MKFIKANWAIVVALGLPLMLIAIIFAAIYIPSIGVKPAQDFIFVTGNNYDSSIRYSIRGNILEKVETPPASGYYNDPYKTQGPELYYYEVKNNNSRPITHDEAKKLRLNNSTVSRDGFTVTYGRGGGGIFFGMFGGYSDYNSRYLVKGPTSIKLNLPVVSNNYYSGDFEFLAWVQ